jgi:hypothetical protein
VTVSTSRIPFRVAKSKRMEHRGAEERRASPARRSARRGHAPAPLRVAITVNAVAPGWIVTEMASAGYSDEEFQARVRKRCAPTDARWPYVELLAAFFAADLPADRREAVVAAAQSLSADDRSIAACRVRGFTISHADWILATRQRVGRSLPQRRSCRVCADGLAGSSPVRRPRRRARNTTESQRYRQRRGVPCVTGIWFCNSPDSHH